MLAGQNQLILDQIEHLNILRFLKSTKNYFSPSTFDGKTKFQTFTDREIQIDFTTFFFTTAGTLLPSECLLSNFI